MSKTEKPIKAKKTAPVEAIAAPVALGTRTRPAGLSPEACVPQFDISGIPFGTTADIEVLDSVIEQDRAVKSLELGLSINRPNYHVYVAGPSGTGKRSQLRTMLTRIAPDRDTPQDWVYLHNFADNDAPLALGLKAGDGKKLKKAMDKLLERCKSEIPRAFHSPEHQLKLQHVVSASNTESTDALVQLTRQAEVIGFQVRTKNDELLTQPIVGGKALSDKEVMALPEEERKAIDKKREALEPLFTEFVQTNRAVEQATQEAIAGLQRQMATRVCKGLFSKVKTEVKSGGAKLAGFLKTLQEDVLEHISRFLPDDSEKEDADGEAKRDPFIGFRVNLVVDNSQTKGAPVVFESHPTFYRLFGKLERRVEQGIYFTDHTMLRAGSMARANGGFLVCHAADLVGFVGVWDNLKVTLRNGELTIEDLQETAGLLPTSGLKPEPIPLQVKIVLIGSNSLYHKLYQLDDDFRKIFRVKADFDHEIRTSPLALQHFVQFIATSAKTNETRPVDREGVLAILEYGARLVDSQKKLTLRFNRISNLLIEADWFAAKDGRAVITKPDLDAAMRQRTLSSSLIADKMHEDLLDDQWLMESTGSAVGVINGLAVLSIGEHQFGRPFRITARCFAGTAGIVNIEREVAMSGEIHDKGVQILSGFLGDRFARKKPLCLTATVTFEQSYGEVDGDSASSTWLFAILSAISGVPIDQGIGVTGSVNQLGQIQPIGGVNEKVEGFFRFCQAKGMTGKQGVVIPWQNVQHLVLSAEVREAMAAGQFHIWPIHTMEEGMAILTGVEVGTMQDDGTYPPGTLMAQAAARIDELRRSVGSAIRGAGKRGLVGGAAVKAKRRRDDEWDEDGFGDGEDDDGHDADHEWP